MVYRLGMVSSLLSFTRASHAGLAFVHCTLRRLPYCKASIAFDGSIPCQSCEFARALAERILDTSNSKLGRKWMFCSQCGNANDIAAKYCSNCGSVLPQAVQNAPTPHAKINASGNSEEFYKAIVGPKNQGYYLHHFSRFDSTGKGSASWHWPAFFVTFSWFLYRKMWLNALIYFFLLGLVNILYVFAETAEKSGGTIIYKVYFLLYFVGIVILPPMYANALYYKHCKKKISETSASSHDLQSRLSELSEKGRTSIVGVVFSVMQIIAIIGILAAVAVPAYQSSIKKATSTEITTPALQQQKSESEMKPGIVFKDCTDC